MSPSIPPENRLTEELAHRLLARAVELDATRDASISLTELRAAALEAGINPEAFDQAIRDITTETEPAARIQPIPPSSRWARILSNALAVGGFWLALVGVTSLSRLFGIGWELRALADVLALVAGVILAHRLNAQLAKAAFIGMGAAQLAELLIQLFFGLQSVRGATTHWAVLLAGLLAVVGLKLSNLITARPNPLAATPPIRPATSDAAVDSPDPSAHRRITLTSLSSAMQSRAV